MIAALTIEMIGQNKTGHQSNRHFKIDREDYGGPNPPIAASSSSIKSTAQIEGPKRAKLPEAKNRRA